MFSKRVLYFITLRSSFLFNILIKSLFVGFLISVIYIKRLASEDHQTILNSRLAHTCLSYPTLALPHLAKRTLYDHIWSQARMKRLCPYLGLSQSAMLVLIFGVKPAYQRPENPCPPTYVLTHVCNGAGG